MNIAFIPVRGGSKSIPLKNIKPINGMPLVYWTIKAAVECSRIDRVYVATDSDKIKETAESFKSGPDGALFAAKLEVVGRSAASATDTASTEFAMLEFAEPREFDNIVLIQATSPLLQASDLERGFALFDEPDCDSVLSVVPQKRFYWRRDESGAAVPTNYDVFKRPRRQDFEGSLVENGAFYISTREALLRTKNRVSGRIKALEMCEDAIYEIDEPSDWIIVEALMKKNGIWARRLTAPIKMVLTDCDGCLTDCGMYYSETGDELKKFNTRDGMGFEKLRNAGIVTGIITSENVALNRRRAEKMKLDELVQGCKDKLTAIRELCAKYGCELSSVAYVGDDANDVAALSAVGFSACPSNARPEARAAARFVTPTRGGEGVLRDVAERVLALNAALESETK